MTTKHDLKVGDKRIENLSGYIFEIVAIGNDCVFCRYTECSNQVYCREFSQLKSIALDTSKPYQEPKPVRKLVAWEYKDTGEITFFLGDKAVYADYRKLSDEEMKELFSFLGSN